MCFRANRLPPGLPRPARAGFQDGALQSAPNHAARPDQAVELREQCRCSCGNAFQALPAKHQQVIYLRFYVDDSLRRSIAARAPPARAVRRPGPAAAVGRADCRRHPDPARRAWKQAGDDLPEAHCGNDSAGSRKARCKKLAAPVVTMQTLPRFHQRCS